METSFPLINDLVKFLNPLDAWWFVSGGWALDIHLDRMTRERGDLDISIPFFDRLACIEFFLNKDWQIEGKRFDSFKTIQKLFDYDDEIYYFWSFPKGAEFVSEYIDTCGNRRIAYNRKAQNDLDYIEVFFDRIEDGNFLYRRDHRVKRHLELAVLERNGVRYLAPELVLLFKSSSLSEKNRQDYNAVFGSLNKDALIWLENALKLAHGGAHPWLEE